MILIVAFVFSRKHFLSIKFNLQFILNYILFHKL